MKRSAIQSPLIAWGLVVWSLIASAAGAEPRLVKEPAGRATMRSGAIPPKKREPRSERIVVQRVQYEEPVPAEPVPAEPAPAEPPPEAPASRMRLTLEQLQGLALDWNPTLAQAAAGVESERGTYRQVGLYPNPQLGYLNNSASPSSVQQSNGVFISQEFVTGNKLGLARVWEGHEVNRVGWEAEAQRMRVLNDLSIRYYEVLGAQEAVFVAQDLEKIAKQGLDTAETLLENKQGAKTDVLRASIQLETVVIDKEDALFRHYAAWRQLANIVGDPALQPALLDGSLESAIPELDFDASLEVLMANSPQLVSSQAALDNARAELPLTRAQNIPNVTVQAVIERDNATKSTTASTLVALPIPIFNRNQGNIQRVIGEIRAAEAEICRVQLVLRDLLAESFRRYETNRLQVQRFREKILPSAKENLELAEVGFRAGELTFLDLLTARQTYFQASLAKVEALTELRKVVVEIEGLQLTGGLNPAEVGGALQAQPGGGAARQRLLLKQVQEGASQQLLPAAQLGR